MDSIMGGRLFGLDQQMFISVGIQLFNACFLAVMLSYILYKPVLKFLRKRTDRIRTQMGRAEEDMAKASEMKAQYEKKLGEIESERAEILETARQLAAEKSLRMVDEAKKEANAMRERAAEDLRKERERAENEMKSYIIEISSMIAGKYVADSISGDTRDRLFDEAAAELEDAAWPN